MHWIIAFVLLLLPGTTDTGQQTAAVAKKQVAAVVEITTKDQTGKPLTGGSGFLVRADGVFVTNAHVIDGAASASVELSNGDVFDDVVLLDSDERRDLAILKVRALNTPTSKLGDSDLLEVGQHVIAIGNPEGELRFRVNDKSFLPHHATRPLRGLAHCREPFGFLRGIDKGPASSPPPVSDFRTSDQRGVYRDWRGPEMPSDGARNV